MQNTKSKTTKIKVADLKFLRLPIDDLTKTILDDLKSQNPYFSDLDCVRYILGIFYKQNSRQKLLRWLDTNVATKNLPKMTEDEILKEIQDI